MQNCTPVQHALAKALYSGSREHIEFHPKEIIHLLMEVNYGPASPMDWEGKALSIQDKHDGSIYECTIGVSENDEPNVIRVDIRNVLT